MLNLLKRLAKEEEGQGLIEYGLIAALISVVAIAAIIIIGPIVEGLWTDVQTEVQTIP